MFRRGHLVSNTGCSNAPNAITLRSSSLHPIPSHQRHPVGLPANSERRAEGKAMLDKQNQGPQCTACGSPMKLSAIEPSSTGQDLRTLTQIRIKGSKDVLERAVLASRNGSIPGSQMSTQWRTLAQTNGRATPPSGPKSAWNASPLSAKATRVNEPVKTV